MAVAVVVSGVASAAKKKKRRGSTLNEKSWKCHQKMGNWNTISFSIVFALESLLQCRTIKLQNSNYDTFQSACTNICAGFFFTRGV